MKFYTLDNRKITSNDELHIFKSIDDAMSGWSFEHGETPVTVYEVILKPIKKLKLDVVSIPLKKKTRKKK